MVVSSNHRYVYPVHGYNRVWVEPGPGYTRNPDIHRGPPACLPIFVGQTVAPTGVLDLKVQRCPRRGPGPGGTRDLVLPRPRAHQGSSAGRPAGGEKRQSTPQGNPIRYPMLVFKEERTPCTSLESALGSVLGCLRGVDCSFLL